MIFSINAGHSKSGTASGAMGFFSESVNTRIIVNRVINILTDLGNTVINCTVDNANSVHEHLKNVVTNSNKQWTKCFISVHFNASNGYGHGVEVYTYKGAHLAEANNILNNIASLGFTNRGIKDGTHLYEVKNTTAPAVLVECCFCDNQQDFEIYKNHIEDMARAIAYGIIGKEFEQMSEKASTTEFEKSRKNLMEMGITDGSRPKDNITREEVFALIDRTIQKIKG